MHGFALWDICVVIPVLAPLPSIENTFHMNTSHSPKFGMWAAIAAVALLGATGAGLGYWSGHRIHQQFEPQLHKAARSLDALDIRAQLHSYERGIFSSSAHTVWTAQRSDGQRVELFKATHHIQHAPWLWPDAAHVRTAWTASATLHDKLPAQWHGQPLLMLDTRVDLRGSQQHSLRTAALNAADFSHTRIDMQAAELHWAADTKGQVHTLRFALPALRMDDGLHRINVQQLRWNLLRTKPSDAASAHTGSGELHIGELSLHGVDHSLQAQSVQWHISAQPSTYTAGHPDASDVTRLDIPMQLSLRELHMQQRTNAAANMYSPHMRLKLRLEGVSEPFIATLLRDLRPAHAADAAAQTRHLSRLNRQAERALALGMKLNLSELHIDTAHGPLTLHYQASIAEHRAGHFRPLHDLSAQLHLELPDALLHNDSDHAWLHELHHSRILLPQPSAAGQSPRSVLDAAWQRGELELHGQPLSPEQRQTVEFASILLAAALLGN